MKSKLLISVGLVVCLLMAFALPMCAPTPAPPVEEEKPPVEEEKPPVEEELAKSIKAYTSSSVKSDAATVAYIKEKLGVIVKHHFTSCGVTHAKLIAEAPNFSVDMVIGAGGPQAFDAKKKGWAIPYDAPTWRDAKEPYRDPDNYWWAVGTTPFIMIYNEEAIAEAGYAAPEHWEDLLDPKWKGQIVMPSPITSGTGYRILYGFLTEYGFNAGKGEEGGWEFYEKLNKNVAHYTEGGGDPVDLVVRKEFMVGLSTTSQVRERIEEGYPITWLIPEEGTAYDICSVFILEGTQEEYTCKKIVDVLGTLDFAKRQVGWSSKVSRFPDAESKLFGTKLPTYFPDIDMIWAGESKARLCEEWGDRFLR